MPRLRPWWRGVKSRCVVPLQSPEISSPLPDSGEPRKAQNRPHTSVSPVAWPQLLSLWALLARLCAHYGPVSADPPGAWYGLPPLKAHHVCSPHEKSKQHREPHELNPHSRRLLASRPLATAQEGSLGRGLTCRL